MGLCVAPLYRGWGRCWTDMNTTAAAAAKIQKNHRQEGGGCQCWSRKCYIQQEGWQQSSYFFLRPLKTLKNDRKKYFFFPGAKWRSTATTQNKQWHLNGRPKDPAPLFLPQPWAWLMSCVLTSPSCRTGPASQVCPVIPPPWWVWELVSHSDAHTIAALLSTLKGHKHKLTMWTEVWQSYWWILIFRFAGLAL